MKKILGRIKPLHIAFMSLLIVTCSLRYYLLVNSQQLAREFKNQNFKELYSADTISISSRLNSLSTVINWVCIEGSVDQQSFYQMAKGKCDTGLFKQKQEISLPEANNTLITLTVRLPKEAEVFFALFLILQSLLIIALINSTRRSEELKRLDEMKISKLARQMSHDIRSPLATLNTILSDLEGIPSESFSLIERSIKRINDISNSLFEHKSFSEDMRTLPPKILPINILKALEETIEEKIIEYKENSNVSISIQHFSSTKVICKIDEVEFKRSISNLINNSVESIKSSRSKLNIHIQIQVTLNDAIINIRDNGVGIPHSVIERIGKIEFTTKKFGNGLGLIHTFENVKNWNGMTTITSSPEVGTCITITLPLVKTSQLHILIDNDELVRLTWESKARKQGIVFYSFNNSKELFIKLPEIPLDSIFYIDSELDYEKGEEVAKILHERGYINLNMCSGYGESKFSHLSFINTTIGKSPPF